MSEAEEIQKLKQQVALLEGRLAISDAELQDFLYVVSHDVKAPLRAIMASGMILLEDYSGVLDAAGQNELKRQTEASRLLNKMMEELLKISRLNRQEMNPAELDLSTLFKEVAQRSGLSLSQVTVEENLTARADPSMMWTFFSNLIDNAIKFAKPEQPVQLTFGKDGEGFFVRDEGIGAEPEGVSRVFLPFEKLNGATYPGLGMGLTTNKRIIGRHDGKISFTSVAGESSTLHFTLPVN